MRRASSVASREAPIPNIFGTLRHDEPKRMKSGTSFTQNFRRFSEHLRPIAATVHREENGGPRKPLPRGEVSHF
jgi:hypothetical protein